MASHEMVGQSRISLVWVALVPIVIVVGFLLFPGVSRLVLGLFLVLFIPGFTMVYALFNDEEIDDVERVALSFGLSICLVIFDGLLLNYTPWGFALPSIVISLTGISAAFTAVGYFRRRR